MGSQPKVHGVTQMWWRLLGGDRLGGTTGVWWAGQWSGLLTSRLNSQGTEERCDSVPRWWGPGPGLTTWPRQCPLSSGLLSYVNTCLLYVIHIGPDMYNAHDLAFKDDLICILLGVRSGTSACLSCLGVTGSWGCCTPQQIRLLICFWLNWLPAVGSGCWA